jgi:triosephosphate isomerase
MNGLLASVAEFENIVRGARDVAVKADIMICPPATLLAIFMAPARGSSVILGAQDCHPEPSGAFTGDISAEMLKDAGARAVIVGHSERRIGHGETDAQVRAKAQAAQRAGLTAIVCVGETQAQRQQGETLAVLGRQLEGSLPQRMSGETLVVAYEPVWAIGSGLTPTPEDVGEVHDFLRAQLVAADAAAGPAIRILYGGSVKPSNAASLLTVQNVNGALVGGASLKSEEFLAIAAVYR